MDQKKNENLTTGEEELITDNEKTEPRIIALHPEIVGELNKLENAKIDRIKTIEYQKQIIMNTVVLTLGIEKDECATLAGDFSKITIAKKSKG